MSIKKKKKLHALYPSNGAGIRPVAKAADEYSQSISDVKIIKTNILQ
jgi:hypothetical protein